MYKLEIIDSTEFDGLDTRNSYFYKNDIDSLYSPKLPDTIVFTTSFNKALCYQTMAEMYCKPDTSINTFKLLFSGHTLIVVQNPADEIVCRHNDVIYTTAYNSMPRHIDLETSRVMMYYSNVQTIKTEFQFPYSSDKLNTSKYFSLYLNDSKLNETILLQAWKDCVDTIINNTYAFKVTTQDQNSFDYTLMSKVNKVKSLKESDKDLEDQSKLNRSVNYITDRISDVLKEVSKATPNKLKLKSKYPGKDKTDEFETPVHNHIVISDIVLPTNAFTLNIGQQTHYALTPFIVSLVFNGENTDQVLRISCTHNNVNKIFYDYRFSENKPLNLSELLEVLKQIKREYYIASAKYLNSYFSV